MKNFEQEIDFTEQIKQLQADKKAGYPPNCNEGYEEKDGKCVEIVEDNAKKHVPDKGKDKDKGKKKGDDKKGGGNLPPWLNKKKGEKGKKDKKGDDKKGGDNLPPWLKKKK